MPATAEKRISRIGFSLRTDPAKQMPKSSQLHPSMKLVPSSVLGKISSSAAADQAEVGGGVDEAAAEGHGGGSTAGVHNVIGIVVGVAFLGGLARGDDAQLGVDDQLNALGEIVGDFCVFPFCL